MQLKIAYLQTTNIFRLHVCQGAICLLQPDGGKAETYGWPESKPSLTTWRKWHFSSFLLKWPLSRSSATSLSIHIVWYAFQIALSKFPRKTNTVVFGAAARPVKAASAVGFGVVNRACDEIENTDKCKSVYEYVIQWQILRDMVENQQSSPLTFMDL